MGSLRPFAARCPNERFGSGEREAAHERQTVLKEEAISAPRRDFPALFSKRDFSAREAGLCDPCQCGQAGDIRKPAPAAISASRKSHSVFASGTRSSGPSSQNRIHDSRSRTRYSVCSSDNPQRLQDQHAELQYRVNGGRPPFQRGGRSRAPSKTGRNITKSIVAASISSGSP